MVVTQSCQGRAPRGGLTGIICCFAAIASCAHAPAVGRGGPVYAIRVESVNDRRTADSGPISHSACAIQVGDRVARVWLADESRGPVQSPVILEGDAAALRAGVLVERSWSQAVVHKVTDEELAAGAAVVYVPDGPQPAVVELRFDPVRPTNRPVDPDDSENATATTSSSGSLSRR